MAFMRNINDFILTLVALSLPSIAATIDCNGKPFHCLNSTHFMICVDFGSGVSITMDDFVIPCPPTTVCQANNRFECEFAPVTTTTVAPIVTNSPLMATVNNDIVIDTVSDVTTIPFEEYYNTISTTTLSEGNLITRDAVTTELPVNNVPESEVSVAATDSKINETVGVSPNYLSTLATLDIVTDEATVTEVIPNVVKNVTVIFESASNIGGALPNATETAPTDITHINLSDNNIVDVTVNYESNSTLLETIIGATNLLQFNTPPYSSSFNIVTEPILSETTESIISKPIDDKHVYLTTLIEASPELALDEKSIENVTESITTKTTEHKNLIQSQSNSTLNKTTSTGDIIQNDPTTLNTALGTNGFTSNANKSEEQISIAEPILFEEKENTTVFPVDVFLYNQTRDNATESPPETTGYNMFIQSQSNQFNNKPLYNSTSYDVTEPILSEATESITYIYNKQVYLTTLDASPVVVLDEKSIENVTESIPTSTTEHRDLIQSQSNSTLDETILTGDIVQSNPTTLNTALDTYGFTLNVNSSDLSFNEATTKYEKQISTAEPILFEAKENTTNVPVDDKQAYLTTLDASPDVFLDNQTIENATESIAAGPTEYKHLIKFQSNRLNNKPHYDSTIYDVTEPILPEATESIISKPIDDKQAYIMTTLDAAPDVFLNNKFIDTVTESIPTETLEYRHSLESQSNSKLNASMSSGDIEQSYTTTVNTVLNINEYASDAHNSYNLSLNEDTAPYYEIQISTAQNNFELSGNTDNDITQPGTEMANITTIATTNVTTEPVSTNTPNASINTDAAQEVTVKLNVIKFGNKKNTFNDMQTNDLSFKVANHYLNSTEDSFTSTSDNKYENSDSNTNTIQSENLTSFYYVENVTKPETETEVIHLVLPKPPTSNEITTIVHGNSSSADNTSTTYTIPNIHTTIAQNRTPLHENSARTDETQKVITSAVNVNDKTADATVNNNLLQPVTEPLSTPRSNIAHNVVGSDFTNENLKDMSTFIKRIELTAKGTVTNKTLSQNVVDNDMNNSTEINVNPSNQIGLNNRVSVLKADDKIHTVDFPKSTPNDIFETTTQEVDSFTYSNVHYLTDIEEISHDQGVLRNNIISADTVESTSSIFALTTESPKEPQFDAVLLTTTSFYSVSDEVYMAESDTYPTRSTTSSQSEATPSTAFDSINSDKLVTGENEAKDISTASLNLEMTSVINENSYVATEQNIPPTAITNSPQQTLITSSTAFENTNNIVNQVKQVTRQIVNEDVSTDPSVLLISFPINETAYITTEQNIPSVKVIPEPDVLIPDRFKYTTTTTETANDSVHQGSRITIASNFSTTKPSESSALSAQHNREIKETLIATTTSNTSTDLSAIPNLTVIQSNLSGAGVTNFREEINGSTVVDSLTTEKNIDAISKASTDNVLEKYPITIKEDAIIPENIRNSIKTIATAEITATKETNHTEPSRSYIISKLENTSVVTDQTTLNSFIIAADVNYTENQNKLPDSHRVLSNAQAEPNIPEILPERFGAISDPNSPVNKATVVDGITSINTVDTADTKLTQDEINQQSTIEFATLKFSTTETLQNEALKEKDVMPVMPEQKTNSESIVKTQKSNGEINANPIITTDSYRFESHTERKLSFTTSIQESKYQSNLASNTEPWRAIVVTESVVYPTRPYTETLITSSKPYTESNGQMSQDVKSGTPKLNLANPSEKQYINLPQNMEPATKNVLTSSEPSVIFLQVTEPSGIPNQNVQSSFVLKSSTQKSHAVDLLKLVQNQRVLFTENNSINVTTPISPSAITKSDLTTRQPFTASNTQILPKLYVSNVEIVPTTEKLKVSVTPNISPSVRDKQPLVDVAAVPLVKSNNNILKDVIPNAKTHLITVYNSNRTVASEPKIEFNKVQLNITSTTEKTVTQSSDLDIVMVDVVKADSPNLGEIATGSNTHSGISALQKSTLEQVKKRKVIKSVDEVEHETEKEEKPEFAKTNPSNGKIEHLTSTEGIPINKQANVQRIPPINIKQKPVQNVTTRIRPVGSHVENITARYNTKSKSPVANTHNSTLPASGTSKHNFVCKSNNRGRFSDNGDCRKFYICIGKHEPIKGICPNNTVFSELRKQCTKNLSHCVRNNQFQCVSEGRFSDYLYDNIYYICVNNKAHRFIRFKLQCQNGYHLNKTTVRCVLNTESIPSTSQQSQQSKSASEVSTSNRSISAKSEKIKDKVKTNKKFECKRSGKFPEPNDCRKYYICTKLGKSEYRQRNKKCDSDEVYNRDKKKCVDAESYECS